MHTPGPWTVTLGDTIAGAPAYWLIEGAGGVVGDVQSVNADDARLIAAAPALLAALQAVADYWAGGDVPAEIDAQMRAAIASATGADQ
jgi:hypothetical protein